MLSSIRKGHLGCVYSVHGSGVHGAFPLTYVPGWSLNLTPSRCIIDRNHEWCISYLLAYFDISWAYRVIFPAALAAKFEYVLSYGQVRTSLCIVDHRMLIEYLPVQLLSMFFAVPALISTAKLVHFRRLDLFHLLQRLPRLCSAEARYLMTGKEPDPTVQDSHLPFNITSYPEGPTLGKPRDRIVTNIRSTHQHRPPLLPELDYAMWNAWRQDTRFCASCATSVSAIRDKVL